jgi:NAD(P)-dependent dehydrogenase (short-subunit alcohol dehydrogenase family)
MSQPQQSPAPVCIVVGVGPGNGAAFARRFAGAGYAVALLARQTSFIEPLAAKLPNAAAFTCDVTDAGSVERAVGAAIAKLGPPAVLVYNCGSGLWGSVEDITPADFELAWRINALGALLASQAVLPSMKKAGKGTILFVGATASRRGGANFAAFAPAKAAQKILADSMARQLGPQGIHVATLLIDGMVDVPGTRDAARDKPESFYVKPDDVARVAHHIVRQRKSTWSSEIEVRPFGEKW